MNKELDPITERETAILDIVDPLYALKTAKSLLTTEQKNKVLYFNNGVRILVIEYIDAAIENLERKFS